MCRTGLPQVLESAENPGKKKYGVLESPGRVLEFGKNNKSPGKVLEFCVKILEKVLEFFKSVTALIFIVFFSYSVMQTSIEV